MHVSAYAHLCVRVLVSVFLPVLTAEKQCVCVVLYEQ